MLGRPRVAGAEIFVDLWCVEMIYVGWLRILLKNCDLGV